MRKFSSGGIKAGTPFSHANSGAYASCVRVPTQLPDATVTPKQEAISSWDQQQRATIPSSEQLCSVGTSCHDW